MRLVFKYFYRIKFTIQNIYILTALLYVSGKDIANSKHTKVAAGWRLKSIKQMMLSAHLQIPLLVKGMMKWLY